MGPRIRALKSTVFLVFLLSIFMTLSAGAFTLTPMNVSISLANKQNLINFKVTNDSTEQIALVLKVTTRSMDLDGNEINGSADKDFVIFPARVILKPNSSQTIKAQYKGATNPTKELSFRFIAEQIPVDFSKEQASGVKIMFRYVAALYVVPKGAAHAVAFGSAVGIQKDGILGIDLIMKNEGTMHALLFAPRLTLKRAGTSELTAELYGDTLSALRGQNLLAKTERKFFIPWDKAVVGAAYEGAFNAQYE